MPTDPRIQNPVTLTFAGGLNNRSRETDVPMDQLLRCDNLDVTTSGNLLVRKGLREIATGNYHSWYNAGDFSLVAKDADLYRFDGSTLTLVKALTSLNTLKLANLNGEIYYTNGVDVGRVVNGTYQSWGLNTPASPVATAVSNQGGLPAGEYQATWAALVNGLESGAPEPDRVTVAEGGGVQVTVPTGATFALYLSTADGGEESLRKVTEATSGSTVILGQGNRGKRCESLYAIKPLPGQYIVEHKGRLWVASGSIVWFTDSLSPHWLFPQKGHFLFPETVDLLVAAEDGVYVAHGNRTYYIQGNNPYEATMRPVSNYGAIPGTGQSAIPYDVLLGEGSIPTRSACWMDTEGAFCIGRPGGIVQRFEDRFLAGNAGSGLIAYRDYEGMEQFVVSLQDGQTPNRATSVSVSEVFDYGIVLNP